MVNIFYEDIEILELSPEFFVSWLSGVCQEEGKELAEINIICCADEYLLTMNKEYLNHDYYTDIITFDNSDAGVSGDLFISIDRIKENALDQKVPFKDELNRVIVHGVLHLLGYGDKTKEEKPLMTEKENFYLAKIVPRET